MYPIFQWDLFFATLKQLIASIYTPKEKSRPDLVDFLVGELPTEPPTPEELEAKLDQLAAVTGGATYEN